MEFSQKTPGNASVDLAKFMDHHECTLPRTVKLVYGFCGTNEDETLEADQIFVFFKVERHKTIMAINQNGQEVCVQQNSNTKVHLLPLECHTYSTVQELLTAKSPFILVLEDILSAGIVSGSKLRLSSNRRSVPNCLKCQVGDQDDFRDVLLPSYLAGKFLPLLDVSDYYLNEVLAQNQLPVNVRFVSQSRRINDRFTAYSLTSLGNICLTRKTEVAMVFAASVDNELSLYLFPKTLDINVGCGFKVSAETSKKIKGCKKALETSETAMKRLDNVVKSSFYFTACPVRRFNLQSLQKTPPMPLPRTLRAKHSQLPEEKLYVNKEESTKGDLVVFASNKRLPSRKPISGECEDDGDYENCKMGEKSEIFTDSRRQEFSSVSAETTCEVNDPANSEIPALPPKRRSASTGENESKDAKPQSPSRPVPKPRKRPAVKAGSQEKMSKDSRTQWQGENVVENTEFTQRPRTLSEDHVDETCPELPPRPIFLQQLHIDNEEDLSVISQEDSPPPLPPKQGEETCPEERHQCARSDTPPPELPPRDNSLGENHLGLAYAAVDVTDWKRYEDPYGAYAEVKDDGRVFKQNEARNSGTEDYLVMKEQKPEVETPCEETERLRPREAGMQVEEKSSEDDEAYEEVIVSHKSSQREFRLETNTGHQMRAGVEKPSKNSNSSSHNAKCSTQTSRERAVKASRPVNNNDIWISSRSEEDCMDFKDIEQYLKLTKQLNTARAQVQDLKQQVAVKEQDPAERTWMRLPDTSDGMTSSCSSGNNGDSQHLDKDLKEENRKNGKSNSKNEEGDGFGKSMEREQPNSSSLVVNNIVPKKAESIVKERKMSTPNDSESDDDDDYENCYDRIYVNQDITVENNSAYRVNVSKEEQCSGDSADDGIEPTYYNTAEIEAMTDGTSRYLQLGNSSDEDEDEDENDYVNVDAQNCDRDDVKGKPFGTKEEECDIMELPPLPPKQMARCS